ncbi:hypothetical protein IP84_17080 [beta proteobacterium AAP99]|nr:hypothetical protein IP84_17080 [beta proteobacterium AAP99]
MAAPQQSIASVLPEFNFTYQVNGSGGPVTTEVGFENTGNVFENAGFAPVGSWRIPTGAYTAWVRFTELSLTGAVNSGSTVLNTWQTVSPAPLLGIIRTSGLGVGTGTGVYLFEIASDSGGVNRVAQGRLTLIANRTS